MNKSIITHLQQLIRIFKDLLDRLFPTPFPAPVCPVCTDTKTVKPAEPEKLYSKQEVMRYLNISSSTYHRYKIKGILKVERIGRRDYIKATALQDALKESIRKGKV